MNRKGKKFDQLVSDIEMAFSGTGAKIKKNDRIEDVETGIKREVDISIRAKVGSMDFLTIVECRDRNKKADVTWIEQLEEKRKSVGADKVVAVSREGFTEGALNKARSRNIETRILNRLDQDQIREWVKSAPISAFHLRSLVSQRYRPKTHLTA